MDQFYLLTIFYLLSEASLKHVCILLELFFQFLGQLNHTELLGDAAMIFRIRRNSTCLFLCFSSFKLDPEGVVLFERLVAQTRPHLEYEVSVVPETERLLHDAHL